MERIEKVKQIVREILENSAEQSLAHRWDHVQRVYTIALKIAEKYNNVDTELLQLAALLHDLDQPFNNKKEHAKLSAKKAAEVLAKVGYSRDVIEKVCKIILEHSSENELETQRFSCLESKILFDADKIDGAGAIGIARALILFGQQGRRIDECLEWYKKKIEKTLPFLQTEEARNLALRRLKFAEEFFNKYQEEINLSDIK